MQYFEIGIWALLGFISGSFVNVCLARIPLQFMGNEKRSSLLTSPEFSPYLKKYLRERTFSLANPARSFCFSCGHQLSWFENIPVLSYLLSRGHCRNCNAPFGVVTILTESLHGTAYLGFGCILNDWIWSLTFCINFSFLWILGHCWEYQKVRMKLFFAGLIILLFNFGNYIF